MNPNAEATINKKTNRDGMIPKPSALIDVSNQSLNSLGENLSFFPIAGIALIEYQIRTVAEAGIDHIVLWTEDLFSEDNEENNSALETKAHFNFQLVNVIERLRKEAIYLSLIQGRQELSAAFSDNQSVLLLEGDCLPSIHLVETLVRNTAPTLLTIEDGISSQEFERIDASERWGGIALVEGKIIKEAKNIPDDWDLILTIMRQTMQSGCKRITIKAPVNGNDFIFKITKNKNNAFISKGIYQATKNKCDKNIFYKKIFSKIIDKNIILLTKKRNISLYLLTTTFVFIFSSLLFSLTNMPILSVLSLILSGLSGYGSRRINEMQLNTGRKKQRKLIYYSRRMGASLALICSSYYISKHVGWGIFPLDIIIILANISAYQDNNYCKKLSLEDSGNHYLYFEYILWIILPFTLLSKYNVSFVLCGLILLAALSIVNYGFSTKKLQKGLEKI